jgi:hypothetical protein
LIKGWQRAADRPITFSEAAVFSTPRSFDQEVPAWPDAIAEDDVAASLSGERR